MAGVGSDLGGGEERLQPCLSPFHSFLVVLFVLFEVFWLFIKLGLSLEERGSCETDTEMWE